MNATTVRLREEPLESRWYQIELLAYPEQCKYFNSSHALNSLKLKINHKATVMMGKNTMLLYASTFLQVTNRRENLVFGNTLQTPGILFCCAKWRLLVVNMIVNIHYCCCITKVWQRKPKFIGEFIAHYSIIKYLVWSCVVGLEICIMFTTGFWNSLEIVQFFRP